MIKTNLVTGNKLVRQVKTLTKWAKLTEPYVHIIVVNALLVNPPSILALEPFSTSSNIISKASKTNTTPIYVNFIVHVFSRLPCSP